jgi:uncharacterized protein (DUF1330 family)
MDAADRRELARRYDLRLDEQDELGALQGLGDGPIAVVNFFTLRPVAVYEEDAGEGDCSGVEAMLRYAAVSADRLAAVGGRFVAQALPTGVLWGDDGDWDLVVVAEYPSKDALVNLLADPVYEQAFRHRRAAVASQRVTVASAIG